MIGIWTIISREYHEYWQTIVHPHSTASTVLMHEIEVADSQKKLSISADAIDQIRYQASSSQTTISYCSSFVTDEEMYDVINNDYYF